LLYEQKQLLKEQLQYLDYLDKTRELDRQKEAYRECLIREDQQEQNNKYLRIQKLDAAARRRLYCDASEVQKLQREEKGNYAPYICFVFLQFCLWCSGAVTTPTISSFC